MRKRRSLLAALVVAVTVSWGLHTTAAVASDPGLVRTISALRVVSFPTETSLGADGLNFPEGLRSGDEALILEQPSTGARGHLRQLVNRSLSTHPVSRRVKAGPTVTSAAVGTAASVGMSFNGLTHRDQRLANGGNQFSLEPPDQGLCVGNGFILETVNDVLRVYNTSGSP